MQISARFALGSSEVLTNAYAWIELLGLLLPPRLRTASELQKDLLHGSHWQSPCPDERNVLMG